MLHKQYQILPERCLNCKQCLWVCPVGAIEAGPGQVPHIRTTQCRRCGACKKICKHSAITRKVMLRFI